MTTVPARRSADSVKHCNRHEGISRSRTGHLRTDRLGGSYQAEESVNEFFCFETGIGVDGCDAEKPFTIGGIEFVALAEIGTQELQSARRQPLRVDFAVDELSCSRHPVENI